MPILAAVTDWIALSERARGQDASRPVSTGARAIEAGARCVTLAFSRWPFGRMLQGDYNWDWHKDNFAEVRETLPLFDLGLSALIDDLDRPRPVEGHRGRRLGRIRPHAENQQMPAATIGRTSPARFWPAAACVRTGDRLDDRWGEEPLTRPVHFREVFATLYQRLGIDVATNAIHRPGRPPAIPGRRAPSAAGTDRLACHIPKLSPCFNSRSPSLEAVGWRPHSLSGRIVRDLRRFDSVVSAIACMASRVKNA